MKKTKRSKKSRSWVIKQHRDHFFKKSKTLGYRSRSAFKLIELDNYTPDYVDRLPKDIYDGDVRKKLRKCKIPTLSKLPIKNVTKIDNNVTSLMK